MAEQESSASLWLQAMGEKGKWDGAELKKRNHRSPHSRWANSVSYIHGKIFSWKKKKKKSKHVMYKTEVSLGEFHGWSSYVVEPKEKRAKQNNNHMLMRTMSYGGKHKKKSQATSRYWFGAALSRLLWQPVTAGTCCTHVLHIWRVTLLMTTRGI